MSRQSFKQVIKHHPDFLFYLILFTIKTYIFFTIRSITGTEMDGISNQFKYSTHCSKHKLRVACLKYLPLVFSCLLNEASRRTLSHSLVFKIKLCIGPEAYRSVSPKESAFTTAKKRSGPLLIIHATIVKAIKN